VVRIDRFAFKEKVFHLVDPSPRGIARRAQDIMAGSEVNLNGRISACASLRLMIVREVGVMRRRRITLAERLNDVRPAAIREIWLQDHPAVT
jgi:hypothetical protein